jgi:hypothetical protein
VHHESNVEYMLPGCSAHPRLLNGYRSTPPAPSFAHPRSGRYTPNLVRVGQQLCKAQTRSSGPPLRLRSARSARSPSEDWTLPTFSIPAVTTPSYHVRVLLWAVVATGWTPTEHWHLSSELRKRFSRIEAHGQDSHCSVSASVSASSVAVSRNCTALACL